MKHKSETKNWNTKLKHKNETQNWNTKWNTKMAKVGRNPVFRVSLRLCFKWGGKKKNPEIFPNLRLLFPNWLILSVVIVTYVPRHFWLLENSAFCQFPFPFHCENPGVSFRDFVILVQFRITFSPTKNSHSRPCASAI